MANVKLQHKTRRDGLIIVGKTHYNLDSTGCVEVSKEHADMLLQGIMWRPPEYWRKQGIQLEAIESPVIKNGARRPRTKKELETLAETEGLLTVEKSPTLIGEEKLKSLPTIEESVEEEEELIEIRSNMPKAELSSIANRFGLDTEGKTKTQILEMLEEVS